MSFVSDSGLVFRAVFTWLSKGIGFGFGFGFTTSFGWLVDLLWFWFYDSQVKTALSNEGDTHRQRGQAVRAPDLQFGGPEFKSRSEH